MENGSDLKPQTVADAQYWHGTKLDTDTVWDEDWFVRGYESSDTSLLLLPSVPVDLEGLRLSLCLWGKDETDHATGLDFGDGWPEQDREEGVVWTGKDLAPIGDDGTIDLQLVRKAADDALAAVRARIRG